ncbi:3602_t:CDS:2, partial [Acaulospora morrowiae]
PINMKFNLGDVTSDLRRNLTVQIIILDLQISILITVVNNDTKHLSKFLSSERSVWNALSTLAYEQSEASKCMAIWGRSEDVDLCDVTEKLSVLTAKLSESENVLADKYVQYRTHLKEIRSREDKMKEQRTKKELLWSKIEKEERKSKRSDSVDQKLKDLHKDMENLQKETIEEETKLADFKREKLRTALLVQLDALFEFGEKLIILTRYSRDIIDQIPITDTHPGEPRAPYLGQEKTLQAVSNATKALEEWTPQSTEKSSAHLQISQVTMSEDSQEELLTTDQPGHVITQPPQNTPNIEQDEFHFVSHKQKPLSAISTTTPTENITSSNAKYYEDPNEADHSDLDQTTDADQELETPRKVREVISHITEGSITEATNIPFHTIQVIPRPPTPPIRHTKSVSFEEEESPESLAADTSVQATQSKDQEIVSSHVIESTLDSSTEVQNQQSEKPAQNDSANDSEPSIKVSEPSIEAPEPAIEIDNTSPQNEIKQPASSETLTIHNYKKHVHFSDVEDEIP